MPLPHRSRSKVKSPKQVPTALSPHPEALQPPDSLLHSPQQRAEVGFASLIGDEHVHNSLGLQMEFLDWLDGKSTAAVTESICQHLKFCWTAMKTLQEQLEHLSGLNEWFVEPPPAEDPPCEPTHFTGLGTADNVPAFLQHDGSVPYRPLKKDEVYLVLLCSYCVPSKSPARQWGTSVQGSTGHILCFLLVTFAQFYDTTP